jgi:L-ascorbate metabolism protein UlaG (beta-lactamase superfamily)
MLSGQELVQDIEAYRPLAGDLAYWWLGQLGFIIKTASVTLAIDPFLSPGSARRIPPLLLPEELGGMDYVLGTHAHGDHIDYDTWRRLALVSPHIKFVIPAMFMDTLPQKLGIPDGRFIPLDEGGEFIDEKRHLTIRAIASAHEFLETDPVTGLHPYLGYLLSCDGIRVYHAGDTCKYEGLETKLLAEPHIDLFFVPINGRDGQRYHDGIIGNMDFREAVDLVGAVKPGMAVPAHFDMFVSNAEDPYRFAYYLEMKYPKQKYRICSHGSRILLENPGIR